MIYSLLGISPFPRFGGSHVFSRCLKKGGRVGAQISGGPGFSGAILPYQKSALLSRWFSELPRVRFVMEGNFCLGREKLQPFWRLLSFVGPYSATLQCWVLHGGKFFRDVAKGL